MSERERERERERECYHELFYCTIQTRPTCYESENYIYIVHCSAST